MSRSIVPLHHGAPRIPRRRPGIIPCGVRWYQVPLLRWGAVLAVSVLLWALVIVGGLALWSAIAGALQ